MDSRERPRVSDIYVHHVVGQLASDSKVRFRLTISRHKSAVNTVQEPYRKYGPVSDASKKAGLYVALVRRKQDKQQRRAHAVKATMQFTSWEEAISQGSHQEREPDRLD